MGAFLDTPLVDKTYDTDDNGALSVACVSMQGWRVSQEDAHAAVLQVKGLPDGHSFFGVFDGHAGKLAAIHSAEGLLDTVVEGIPAASASAPTAEVLSEALRTGFIKFDASLVDRTQDHSGCTAVTAFVTPTHVIVGNCGDSRAVLAGKSRELFASVDHKPTTDSESKRISEAGGFVAMGRVNGTLAVSRALGDFSFKGSADVAPEKQVVSCEPTCTILPRRDDDDLMLLCCDGIWDVMESQEVVDFCRETIVEVGGDLSKTAAALLDKCLERGSRDNMTACIVALPGCDRGAASTGAATSGPATTAATGGGAGSAPPAEEDPSAP